MATEVESSGLPVSADSATPTGSEEQTAVWPLDYPVSVGMLERRVAETLGKVDATLDGIATDASVDEKVATLNEKIAELKGFAVLEVRANGTTLGPRDHKHVKIEVLDDSKSSVERRGILTPTELTLRVDDSTSGTDVLSLTFFHKDGVTIQKGAISNVLKFPNLADNETIATESGLALKVDKSSVGAATVVDGTGAVKTQGVASLDESGHVPSSQLPSFVDDVLEFASKDDFPGAHEGDDAKGETGKIYVALDTNLTYRWGGTAYVEISPSLALGETDSTAYAGNKGKDLKDAFDLHVDTTKTVNPHKVTASQVGAVALAGAAKSMSLSADGTLTYVVDEAVTDEESGETVTKEVTKTRTLAGQSDLDALSAKVDAASEKLEEVV